ncbi:MAG: amidohydrolase [Candidatus Cloacimonetes bacterium]|nr:amidohydrolase [Candidatus Cloacimonadota bacterium]
MKNTDIIIKNGYIVTINPEMEIIEGGALAVEKGKILAIGATEEIEKNYTSDTIIDASSKIVMPGFINGHTHIAMSFFRGYADDLLLQSWLEDHIWPAEEKFVKAQFVYDSSFYACAELIKNGITMINDMYFYSKETARAATKAGMRAILGECIFDFPMASHTTPESMINYAIEGHEEYKDSDLIDFAMMPHSIYTCSKQNLITASEQARAHNMLIHIHLSEAQKEVDDCLKQYGVRPVQYLDSIGFLGNDVSLAHGVWIDDQEQKLLAKKGVGVNICTECNLKLASGFAPIKGYKENGVMISLATDGVASNNNLSIIDEMDMTAKVHKAINNDPTFLPAEEVVRMVTIDAAKMFNKEDELGSLEVGKKADIILLERNKLENMPMYNVYSHLVYTMHSESVEDVIVNGKVLMQDRKLVEIDEDELFEKAKYYQKELQKTKSD